MFKFCLIGHNIFMKKIEIYKTVSDKDECIFKKPKERIRNEHGQL